MCAQHDHAALPVPSLASTDELAAAMAALPNPVFVFKPVRDPEGAVVELTYTFMNEAAGRLYGKSVDEVLGRGQRELFPSVSELGIWDAYLGVLETGLPVSFDVPWFHENGVQGSFRLAVHRFGDGILVSAHDITEQVKAERALEADRAVLRATLDSLLDPSVRFEAVRDEIGQITDFVYADANPAACAYHNMAYEDLVGTHLLDLLPGVATTGLLTLYEHIVESGEALALDDYPYATEFLGGEERRYDIRAARVRDGLTYTWRDVTDSHLAERRLRSAYNSILDPHVLYEAIRDDSGAITDFRFVDANPAACEYNQWNREQLIGSTLLDQWPDFASDPTREAYAQVLATGEPIMLDDAAWAQERLFGGQIRHYDLRAVRVSGSLLSVTWRDITERYEQNEHDRRMAVIVERSHDAIIGTVPPDATIVSWNPAAEEIYGYTAEEVMGRPAYLLTPANDVSRTRAFGDALAAGEPIPDMEAVRLRKDGSEVHVSISAATICDDEGKVIGLVTFHRDITQQVEAREELARQQVREQKRLAELEQFQRVTVGRELKMIELKKEIEHLRKSGLASGSDPADRR